MGVAWAVPSPAWSVSGWISRLLGSNHRLSLLRRWYEICGEDCLNYCSQRRSLQRIILLMILQLSLRRKSRTFDHPPPALHRRTLLDASYPSSRLIQWSLRKWRSFSRKHLQNIASLIPFQHGWSRRPSGRQCYCAGNCQHEQWIEQGILLANRAE